MRISKAAKKLQTLISFSSARISKNAFGSSCWKFHTARRSLTGSSLKKPELQKPLEQSGLPSEKILSPSSFPATASSAKISHLPVTAAGFVVLGGGEPEEARESHLHAMMKAWMSFALANVAGIILHASALVAVVALWLVWKNKRVVRLLPSEPDKRLGAPHGASQSRPVNYCMQDGRGPDSIGRRQMRQHMRDVS